MSLPAHQRLFFAESSAAVAKWLEPTLRVMTVVAPGVIMPAALLACPAVPHLLRCAAGAGHAHVGGHQGSGLPGRRGGVGILHDSLRNHQRAGNTVTDRTSTG